MTYLYCCCKGPLDFCCKKRKCEYGLAALTDISIEKKCLKILQRKSERCPRCIKSAALASLTNFPELAINS